jgi:hypothetical protein
MGIFNNSDIEKKVLFLQQATKTNAESCVQLISNQTAIVEDFEKFSAFTKEVFRLIQIQLDTADKKIGNLKSVIDILSEDNRRLNEMAIENEKRYIEAIDLFQKLNELAIINEDRYKETSSSIEKLDKKFEGLHKEVVSEKSRLN